MLDPTPVDSSNNRFQKLVKEINNCNATYWKCKGCTVLKINQCYAKTRQYLQWEAFKKYNEREEYRKAQEKLGFPIHTEVK